MESTTTGATRVLQNYGRLDKNIFSNCEKVSQYEKETETEINHSNSEWQYYFSSFCMETSWASSNVILLNLVLPDSISLKLDMNKLIPRVIMTQDRRSKSSMSQLLCTIVTLTLGKRSVELCFNKHLLSAMFKIGCDENESIKKLLQQFMTQIIQYISSLTLTEAQRPITFLEILFQCLNCESNFAIKNYISSCIESFLQNVLDIVQKKDRVNSPICHYTVHKIINLAMYPSYNEPLTAAFAFNHIFSLCISPHLNLIVPNKYWLEFLHSFLINLEKCNEEQVMTALRHIKDTISSRKGIFNAKFPSRRKPSEFSNERLEGAVMWIFKQCGSMSPLLRCKCMQLFEDLCVHVSNVRSKKDFVDKFGIENLNKLALEGFNEVQCVHLGNLEAFVKTLDFYIWIFNGNMATPDVVFMVDKDEKETTYLNTFINFISLLVGSTAENPIKTSAACEGVFRKKLEYISIAVLKIFPFVTAILMANDGKNVIKKIWNDDLCLLLSRFTLSPQKLGVPRHNASTMESAMLKNFFDIVLKHLPPEQLTRFQQNFFIDTQEELAKFSNVQQVMTSKSDLYKLKYFLNAITTLKINEFINFENQFGFTATYAKDKITDIFENLKSIMDNSNVEKNIDAQLIQYFKDVVNFFLFSYTPELAEFTVNFISSEYFINNGTAANSCFDIFKKLMLEFLLKNSVESLQIINKILLSTPKQLLSLLESLLEHFANNPDDRSKILADSIIKNCSIYKNVLDNQYQDKFFKVNKLAVLLSSDFEIENKLPNPLIPYVLQEFDNANSVIRRIEIVEGFAKCFIDGTKDSKSFIVKMFQKIKQERLKIPPERFNTFIERLVTIRITLIWECIILLTCGTCARLSKDVNFALHIETFFSLLPSQDVLNIVETTYDLFNSLILNQEERLDLLDYFLLPIVDHHLTVVTMSKFFGDHYRDMYESICIPLHDMDITLRRYNLINKIGCFRLFELMYGRLPYNIVLCFRVEQRIGETNCRTYLNLLLLRRSHEVRIFTSQFREEKELFRLLHCSALNAYIAIVTQQVPKNFLKMIFKEDKSTDQLVWRKFIDCEKKYDLRQAGPTETKVINILRKNGTRLRLSLEKDELNDHECMAMITGIFLHVCDTIDSTQSKDKLPDWMCCFFEAFDTDEDNVILYLLRVIVNARRAFLPYMHCFFRPIVKVVCSYLCENNINYLIRDILLVIVEADCDLRGELEIQAGQRLVESLIRQAQDSNKSIMDYNIEIIDNLVSIWKQKLNLPTDFDSLIQSNEILAIKIILVFLKNNVRCMEIVANSEVQALVRNRMYRWQEPLSPQIIEILGHLISNLSEEMRESTVQNSLRPLFKEMKRAGNPDLCANMFYLMFPTCPWLVKHKDLATFFNPADLTNNESKAKCFEMFLETIATESNGALVYSKLESMNFIDLLKDRTMLPCVDVAFKIMDKLAFICDAQQLLPYARVIEKYAWDDSLIEHKNNVIWFFIHIYKEYVNIDPEKCDNYKNSLLDLSKKVLINSVSDPSDDLQEDVLDFWRDQLPENTVDRLKCILDLFSLDTHSGYPQFLCLLMLDLTNSYGSNQKILFGPLTPPRDSQGHDIFMSPKQLLKEPIEELKRKINKNNNGARSKIDNADILLSIRTFPKNEEINEFTFLNPIVTRNYTEEFNERLRIQKLEQYNSQKFNHSKDDYLPDVQINQADVVATIEDYAKKCPSYAADLSVLIICGILNNLKGTEEYEDILEVLADMCKKALSQENEFAPKVLEILYQSECPFDADDVLRIATSMNLQTLGILIFEKESIKYDYADLYRTSQRITSKLSLNVHLAMLYRSMNEPDVIESIFKNWKLDSSLAFLREGSSAEAEMDWTAAKDAYEEGFKTSKDVIGDYCMEGLFECLAKLSSWEVINDNIKDTFVRGNDYNLIWEHPNKKQLLPWLFQAQVQEFLENSTYEKSSDCDFFAYIETWMKEKDNSFTGEFGEELSLFFLCNDDNSTAMKCLQSTLKCMPSRSSLTKFHQRAIAKYKRLIEIKLYMNVVEKDKLEGAKMLLSLWDMISPRIDDDLFNWMIQLNYRLNFANLFAKSLEDVSMDSGILSDLIEASLKQQLMVNDMALKYKNVDVARKYSLQIKKTLSIADPDDVRFQQLYHHFKLASCRYAYLHFEHELDFDKRFSYLMSSWHGACSLCRNDKVDVAIRVKTSLHIFELIQSLRSWILTDDEVARRAVKDEVIFRELKPKNPEDLVNLLFSYSFNTLKDICDEGNQKMMADNYATFAEYCQKLIFDAYDRENSLQKEFIFALLKAMSFGSIRAVRIFPCLLKHSIYRDNELLSKLFIENCQTVPSRMFLDWQEEIVSHLVSPLAPQVYPIVEKLCNDFPSTIIFDLRKVRANPVADNLYKTTFGDPKYETFFCSIEFLCQPERYLIHHLQEFINSLCDNEMLPETISLMFSQLATNTSLQSTAFKRVLAHYKKDFEKLTNISDIAVVRKNAEQLLRALHKAMAIRIDKNELTELTKLSYYSPFLNDLSDRDFDVDVPIQYNFTCLRPKIVRIDRFVRAIPSKSKPLAIKVVGSDGKCYEFLVKYGLDLHQDRKMLRIFRFTNQILNDSLKCRNRFISFNTYNVVPLSTTTSLVQWISNAKSLEEIVEYPLTNKSIIRTTKRKYEEWINSASEDETSSKSLMYKRALTRYTAEEVSTKMIELSADIQPNLIQRAFLQISRSLDSYFKMRQSFIKSYATMCLGHWMFGIGDRQLKNTLVNISTGECVNINFGLVFGAGAELPVPELVPFRLTAQVVNLMKPFKERDLFGPIMCHTLKALKDNSNVIVGCLESFLQEPINWNTKLHIAWKNDGAAYNGIEWSAMKKIEILQQKLRGTKPSNVLLHEISCVPNHAEPQFFSLYKLILNGNERFHTTKRSLLRDHELTPEEQILCLLDQATDVNTIGRMWVDWKCFL